MEAEFQADEEQEEGDAGFRDEFEGPAHFHPPEHRADEHAAEQIDDDGRHADQSPEHDQYCGRNHNDAKVLGKQFVDHLLIGRIRPDRLIAQSKAMARAIFVVGDFIWRFVDTWKIIFSEIFPIVLGAF
jgi:hypothetical protein